MFHYFMVFVYQQNKLFSSNNLEKGFILIHILFFKRLKKNEYQEKENKKNLITNYQINTRIYNHFRKSNLRNKNPKKKQFKYH